ncbi:MAG: nucleotide exchange factor GrpE [bacterium]
MLGSEHLRKAFQYIFPDEFVIDEKPLEVYRSGEGPDGDDLATLLSRLLVEHDRLVAEARKLEGEQPTSEDMEALARQALPVLDAFDYVLNAAREHPPSAEVMNWLKSVESLNFRILKLLENFGLQRFNSIGGTVNLDYHEVVEVRRSSDFPDETIVKEYQKGYLFHGRLLREAKVVVAKSERS